MRKRCVLAVLAGFSAFFVLVPLGAGVAAAKEESKISIRLQASSGNGNGNGIGGGQVRGDVRTRLQGSTALLQLRVRGLAAATEHVLLAKEDEAAVEGVELARFVTGSRGQWNGRIDLHKGDSAEAPTDPRGRYLVVSDGAEEILAGWLYGAVEDDPARTKVKELTALEPDPAASGSVAARYDRQPNGHGWFRLFLRDVPAGEYDVWVDGVQVDAVTPNSGGNANAMFTTKPFRGTPRSLPHNRKGPLDFDPRRKLIELKQGDQLFFSGPMLAQIEGLNACSASESVTPFALGPGQTEGSGTVALVVEDDCETSLEVEVHDLPVASYDLYVDGALVGALDVADDGAGNLSGSIDFDPTPDEAGELPLDFEVGTGSVVEVFSAGETTMPLLSATLP